MRLTILAGLLLSLVGMFFLVAPTAEWVVLIFIGVVGLCLGISLTLLTKFRYGFYVGLLSIYILYLLFKQIASFELAGYAIFLVLMIEIYIRTRTVVVQ